MISETAQEQATLHALGLLDADEAAAFERTLGADAELRALAGELREAAAELARAGGDAAVPVALKARLMAEIGDGRLEIGDMAEGGRQQAEVGGRKSDDPEAGKVVAGPWAGSWLPWALAALLMICCGVLAVSRERWRREFSTLERKTAAVEMSIAQLRVATATPALAPVPVPGPGEDVLRRVAFCPLEPQPQRDAAQPHAAVLWDAARREGTLRVSKLPPLGAGKDYQLWVVETGRKDAVSAGVLTTGEGGSAEVPFAPVAEGGTEPVAAFAISVERAGGSLKNEGPILFLGKL